MPPAFAVVARFSWFKGTVFALLALNAGVYLVTGTASEGLDSVAWLVLLVLFELETSAGPLSTGTASIVHGARLVAGVAIPVAAIGYANDEEWLDAINAALWIGVVVLLELQVRFPQFAVRFRTVALALAAALYAGLGAVAVIWLWRADWFGGYDACLWLLAFATIEFNVMQSLRRLPTTVRAAAVRAEQG